MFVSLKVINAHIVMLVRKYNQDNEDQAYLIDSNAMTKIWEGSYRTLSRVTLFRTETM